MEKEYLEVYYIVDYSLDNKVNSSKKNFNSKKGINETVYSNTFKIEEKEYNYDIYHQTINKNKNLNLEFEIEGDTYINNIIKLNDKINFIFDLELKQQKKFMWVLPSEGNERKSNLSEIDKLILFKRYIETDKKNFEDETYKSLVKKGLSLFEKNKNFHFLLILFCISKKDKELSKSIINKFDLNIKTEEKSNIQDSDNEIKEFMNLINENSFTDLDLIQKRKFYAFLLYYKALYLQTNEQNEFIKNLYLNEENKDILFYILNKYNYLFKEHLNLENDIIKDLIQNSNSLKMIKTNLFYIKDILLYLENITMILDKFKDIRIYNEFLVIDKEIVKGNKYEIEKICNYINEISNYQNNNKVKIINFKYDFWYEYINDEKLNIPNKINAQYLFSLRKCLNNFINLDNIKIFNEKWDNIFPSKLKIKDWKITSFSY